MSARRTPQQASRWQQRYARAVREDIRTEPFVGTVQIGERVLQEGESVILAPGYDPIIVPAAGSQVSE